MNSNSEHIDNSKILDLENRLNFLEKRIAQLEAKGMIAQHPEDFNDNTALNFKFGTPGQEQIESHIGEYGMAWLGNVVLFLGITFLVQFLQSIGLRFLSVFFGYFAVTGIFLLAYLLRKSNPYMTKIFNVNGYILVFFVTLKLYFFTTDPIVTNRPLALILLFIVTGTIILISLRKKQSFLAGLALIQWAIISVLSDATHLMLPLAAIIAIVSVVLLLKFGWIRLIFLSISLVYLINILWMFNNPMMGHEIMAITNQNSGFIYLFIIAATYSLMALFPKNEILYNSNNIIGAILFNGIGFFILITLFIITFFKEGYVAITGSIAIFCIIYSIILHLKSNWKITAAFYALFGFVTLSVSIYGLYEFPRAYFLLAIQSLLVVSIAIWFRSKFIVIINSLLFIILLMVYLSTAKTGNGMNISFSIVALATARILNWKKERLTIQTEFIRNFYLITAFFMVLFTLYHISPGQYISLSWSIAAVLYFVLSLILKNVKYRYMALGTMIAAAIHLFIVDLSKIDLVYRVIALLFLAIISIGLSFYYSKKLKNKAES